MDTDDEAVLHVMNEPKYAGMLHSFNGEMDNEGGNIRITSVYHWDEYEAFSKAVVPASKFHDWIVLDFISGAWPAVQEGFLMDAANKTRGETLYKAGVEGLSGWDMFKTDFNWNAINGSYFDFIKPILIQSRAHVFMTSEEQEIDERKASGDDKEHLAQFGKYKFVGQKKLAYQCRSYLRKQRLARGRVLSTNGKDRARKELQADDCKDFMKDYLQAVAGWTITDPA